MIVQISAIMASDTKEKNMKNKCLLIETSDNNRYFTEKSNYLQLIEFVKTFNAKIHIVETDCDHIYSLHHFAKAVSEGNHQNDIQFEIIESKNVKPLVEIKKITPVKKDNVREQAQKIRSYIYQSFKDGECISIRKVKSHFEECDLTDSAYSQHISRVRRDLNKKGYQISRIKKGTYKLK